MKKTAQPTRASKTPTKARASTAQQTTTTPAKSSEPSPAATSTVETATPAASPAQKVTTPSKAVGAKATPPVEISSPVKKPAAAKKATARTPSARSKEVATASASPAAPTPVIEQSVPATVEISKKKKKSKVVRDSFTMPESDYAKIAELKKRSLEAGISIKKSELLRAGLLALEALSPAELTALLSGLENVKTGRPSAEV
ncbi:hypothetical protein OL229_02615 [Neisseriaceae bacterium JH1-16]|nr:hypothetical protein [Neisseriaceae bacterium JH1-16]